jgi:hypothetical protein
MAHFAELNAESIVVRVIVVNNSILLDESNTEQEDLGIQFCQSLYGGVWKQTSYNENFRGSFAGVGYIYDSNIDQFVKPVESE